MSSQNGRVLLACEMLEDEIGLAMKRTGTEDLPVVWVERGLHESPDRLRAELQRQIDAIEADTLLLAYTLCGNAMHGVVASRRLVVPRFHDCIWMGLAVDEGKPPVMDHYSLYYTHGWLQGDRSTAVGYERDCARYGHAEARDIYKMMLHNYRSITMLDTGAYDLAASLQVPRYLAGELELELHTAPGSTRVLEKLLAGRWDEEFVIAPPGHTISQEQFFDWE